MERSKIKFITFHTKKCTEAYKKRTCSPYNYPKYKKCTVPVRKVLCKYKKTITKNCRINDMLKFMDTELLFPMNNNDYTNLLIELTENSNSFCNSWSIMTGRNEISILRIAYYSVVDNHRIIESLLYNELENLYSLDIKNQAAILKNNLVICIGILIRTNDIAEDWIVTKVVENLEIYLTHLRTICTFIYLIMLKKKSTVVNKMLPAITFRSSKIYICSLCGQPEEACMCFAVKACTTNRNNDYCAPEADKNVNNKENLSQSAKSTVHAEIEEDNFMHEYLENYGYQDKKSQDSSTDTD